ncbi:MAG: tripartite tricarboxylate transporter TctB family protein [Ideonella sp.]|nr:tripartite tricarboxylate transporter TctB family protein [Ideonella sp.]MCC7455520.1 tripartite tricarboxylate transporter TctB family protein [Nitrospira sp.]
MSAPEPHDAAPGDAAPSLRSEFYGGCAWMVFGFAVLIGSITMDRLEAQHINPYTVPGLLPGLLGIAMIVLGAALAWRSWRAGALRPAPPLTTDQRDEHRRIWVVAALCIGYGAVLIGHGLPFWLASATYVSASILIMRRMSRDPEQRRLTARAVVQALVIGVASALIVQWVFQDLFLVRLP